MIQALGGCTGGEWIHVYVCLFPPLYTLTITIFSIGYTPIQNKKFNVKQNNNTESCVYHFNKHLLGLTVGGITGSLADLSMDKVVKSMLL